MPLVWRPLFDKHCFRWVLQNWPQIEDDLIYEHLGGGSPGHARGGIKLENQQVPSSSSSPSGTLVLAFIPLHGGLAPAVLVGSQYLRVCLFTCDSEVTMPSLWVAARSRWNNEHQVPSRVFNNSEFQPYLLHFLTQKGTFFKLILEREEQERKKEIKRNIDLLFHLFMHSLADSCTFPDQGLNLQLWGIGMIL